MQIASQVDQSLGITKTHEALEYDSFRSQLKYYLRVMLGMKGYTFISNLWKLKVGDYLGRYDKSFSDRDRIIWEKKLQAFVKRPD